MLNRMRVMKNVLLRSERARGLLLGLLAVALGGCNLAALPFLLWADEPTRKVAAEYPYLGEKRTCIVVWAEMDTLFEYRDVQWELSEFVAAELESKVPGTTVVPCREVVDYQRRTLDWDRQDPAELGKRFGAERLLLIELTQYGTREPDSPHLYRGHVGANLRVYDTAYPKSEPAYRGSVDTVYPPDSVGLWSSDDRGIRRAMMQAFAVDVANKFYDRLVKVR